MKNKVILQILSWYVGIFYLDLWININNLQKSPLMSVLSRYWEFHKNDENE